MEDSNTVSLSFGVINLLFSELLYCTFTATTCTMVGVIGKLDTFIQNINKNSGHLQGFVSTHAARK